MMPRAKQAGIDFEALGKQLMERKNELKESGVPDDAEHRMVSGHGMRSGAEDTRSIRGKAAMSSERTAVADGAKIKSSRKPPMKVKRTA
jgi:hypothetical protein